MHKYIQQMQRNNVIYVDSRQVSRAFCLLNFAEFHNSESIAMYIQHIMIAIYCQRIYDIVTGG